MSDRQPKIVFFLIGRQRITDLSSPGAQSLIVRFNPAARGALLEV